MADLLIASDENEKQIPNVELANRIYVVEQKRKQKLDTGDLLKSILEDIKSDEMADVYVQIIDKFDLTKDEELVATMMASNKTVIEEIETKIADAIQNAGDTEVCQKKQNISIIPVNKDLTSYYYTLFMDSFLHWLLFASCILGH